MTQTRNWVQEKCLFFITQRNVPADCTLLVYAVSCKLAGGDYTRVTTTWAACWYRADRYTGDGDRYTRADRKLRSCWPLLLHWTVLPVDMDERISKLYFLEKNEDQVFQWALMIKKNRKMSKLDGTGHRGQDFYLFFNQSNLSNLASGGILKLRLYIYIYICFNLEILIQI